MHEMFKMFTHTGEENAGWPKKVSHYQVSLNRIKNRH